MSDEAPRAVGSEVELAEAREQRLAALDVFLAESEAAHGEITAAEMETVARRYGSSTTCPPE